MDTFSLKEQYQLKTEACRHYIFNLTRNDPDMQTCLKTVTSFEQFAQSLSNSEWTAILTVDAGHKSQLTSTDDSPVNQYF